MRPPARALWTLAAFLVSLAVLVAIGTRGADLWIVGVAFAVFVILGAVKLWRGIDATGSQTSVLPEKWQRWILDDDAGKRRRN